MQSVVVLCKAAIADLAITEDLLNVPERMFHFGTNTGFDFLGFQLVDIQLLSSGRPFGNEPGDVLAVLMLIPLLNVKVTGVAEDSLPFLVWCISGSLFTSLKNSALPRPCCSRKCRKLRAVVSSGKRSNFSPAKYRMDSISCRASSSPIVSRESVCPSVPGRSRDAFCASCSGTRLRRRSSNP